MKLDDLQDRWCAHGNDKAHFMVDDFGRLVSLCGKWWLGAYGSDVPLDWKRRPWAPIPRTGNDGLCHSCCRIEDARQLRAWREVEPDEGCERLWLLSLGVGKQGQIRYVVDGAREYYVGKAVVRGHGWHTGSTTDFDELKGEVEAMLPALASLVARRVGGGG